MKGFGSHLLGMGSKVYLIEHLAADELYHRYREEQDPIKRTHLQILWLLMSGRPAKVAAEMTGYSQRWISVLVTLPRQTGPDVKFGNHLEEGHDKEDAQAVHGGVQSCSGCPVG
jgi:hypothetical protein